MSQYVLAATGWLNFSGLTDYIRNFKKQLAYKAKVRETIKELSRLSDAELRDIGIHRGDIYAIANEVYLDDLNKIEFNKNLKGWV